MNIYPAIDLLAGKCVRLYQGCYDQVTLYEKDPLKLAKEFAQQGVEYLHVVDLDGANQAKSINLELILKMQQATKLHIQTGGGIRCKQQVHALLSQGITRVILGSVAISQPQTVKEWIKEFGNERIILALDIRMNANNEPKLALHGWKTKSEINLWQLLDEYADANLHHVLCTDISRDGTLHGPNVFLYTECVKRYPTIRFQASGGVSALNDLRELAQIPVASVIVGKAFYENRFSFRDAFNEVQRC